MLEHAPSTTVDPRHLSLPRLFARFLRFGVLAWGGPVAQIGLLREELVDRERWVDQARFNRVLGVYQALPGPEATELCVYFGTVARGRLGGLLAGVAFMLPGTLAVLAAAWLYATHGIDDRLAGLLVGAQLAAVALVLRAVHRIGSHALASRWPWAIAIAAAVATLGGVHFAVVLLAGAAIHALAGVRRGAPVAAVLALALLLAPLATGGIDAGSSPGGSAGTTAVHAGDATHVDVARTGLAAGGLSFGGAYTSVGFVRADAVERERWLTDTQFLDALALSGSLPSPLIVFATFVGYLAGGLTAALVMTVAIFLPAFAITLLGHRTLERVVDEPRVHRLLDGVTAAVVGLIAVTALQLAATVVDGPVRLLLAAAALVALAAWSSRWSIVGVVAGVTLAAGALSALDVL